MFLFDNGQAVKEWDGIVEVVTSTLERYGAEMVLHGKWDERKLAYPIKGRNRGTYLLAYFKAPPPSIAQMRADLLLKEDVLRFLILAMPEDASIPETLEQKRMLPEEEDRRGGFGGDRDRGGFGGGGGGGGGGGRRRREEERPAAAAAAPAAAATAEPAAEPAVAPAAAPKKDATEAAPAETGAGGEA